MDDHTHKQSFNIRFLPTKGVTLYPTKAQIVRNINNVSLRSGVNQITIIGLTPTCDEHSIKVDGTTSGHSSGGVATITDLAVELVPNPEVFVDVYPDEEEDESCEVSDVSDDSDDEVDKQGREKEIQKRIRKLEEKEKILNEMLGMVTKKMETLDSYTSTHARATSIKTGTEVDLPGLLKTYEEERAKAFEQHTEATNRREANKTEIAKLRKEEKRLTLEARKAKLQAEKDKKKAEAKEWRNKQETKEACARLHRERVKFWPKMVYKVTISLETPSCYTPASSRRGSVSSLVKAQDTNSKTSEGDTDINLTLSYITSSASWAPRYDLSLSTVTASALLDYSAELVNITSEVWRDAKITLSTSQSSYTGLSDSIPELQPWHIRLQKSSVHTSGALKAPYEIKYGKYDRIFSQQGPAQQPRSELFGLPPKDLGQGWVRQQQQAQENAMRRMDLQQQQQQNMIPATNLPQVQRQRASSFAQQQQPQISLFGASPSNAAPAATAFGSSAYPTAPACGLFRGMASAAASAAPPAPAAAMARAIDAEFSSAGSPGYIPASPTYSPADDVDGDTLAALADQALSFEESTFEESGLTTTYDLPGTKTLAPTSTKTKHRIARVDFKTGSVVFSHVVVPKLKAAAFLKARLRNQSKITLLKGTCGLTLDGSFLGQSSIPRCSAGGEFVLSLGVDPGVTVGYSRPTVQRSSSGFITKESAEVFKRVVTLSNTKDAASALDLLVLEQVPVSEDERLKVEITTPRFRVLGEAVAAGSSLSPNLDAAASKTDVTGRTSVDKNSWGTATALAKKSGDVTFKVKLNPGNGCKLTLEYEAHYPGGEAVVSVEEGQMKKAVAWSELSDNDGKKSAGFGVSNSNVGGGLFGNKG